MLQSDCLSSPTGQACDPEPSWRVINKDFPQQRAVHSGQVNGLKWKISLLRSPGSRRLHFCLIRLIDESFFFFLTLSIYSLHSLFLLCSAHPSRHAEEDLVCISLSPGHDLLSQHSFVSAQPILSRFDLVVFLHLLIMHVMLSAGLADLSAGVNWLHRPAAWGPDP